MNKEAKSELAVNIWTKLSRTYEYFRNSQARSLYLHNLTGPQFNVLEVLYNHGTMSLKKISERLSVSGANITCVVDNLEKDGLVRRIPSKEDRRVIFAEITPKGKQKTEKVFPIHINNVTAIVDTLSESEQKDLEKILEKLDGKTASN